MTLTICLYITLVVAIWFLNITYQSFLICFKFLIYKFKHSSRIEFYLIRLSINFININFFIFFNLIRTIKDIKHWISALTIVQSQIGQILGIAGRMYIFLCNYTLRKKIVWCIVFQWSVKHIRCRCVSHMKQIRLKIKKCTIVGKNKM